MRFGAGRMRSFSDRLSAWIQGFYISAVPSELKTCREEVCVDHSGGFIIIGRSVEEAMHILVKWIQINILVFSKTGF